MAGLLAPPPRKAAERRAGGLAAGEGLQVSRQHGGAPTGRWQSARRSCWREGRPGAAPNDADTSRTTAPHSSSPGAGATRWGDRGTLPAACQTSQDRMGCRQASQGALAQTAHRAECVPSSPGGASFNPLSPSLVSRRHYPAPGQRGSRCRRTAQLEHNRPQGVKSSCFPQLRPHQHSPGSGQGRQP